jgi:hypothetical protein
MKCKNIFTGVIITSVVGVLVWLAVRFRDHLRNALWGDDDWDEEEEHLEVRVRLDEASR